MDQFHFKVNLKGMIDLLSNHLYSTPHVFIRELIQNGVDAITARKKVETTHDDMVSIEVFSGESPTLFIEDNGMGLTEEEVHYFLSQIGQTSKNGDNEDYIGRFGVGLLSCFIVSDEIVLLTRSIKSDQTIKWRGKPDGSYHIEKVDQDMKPGTRIYLQSKPGFEEYFVEEKVKEYVRYYGEFLPYPLVLSSETPLRLNAEKAPWDMSIPESLKYGRSRFQTEFLDAIPLTSSLGEAQGVAYILPHPVRINAKQRNSVYVKQMLLSDQVDKILPEWTFFVSAVLNVNQLKPTASREEFYEDPLLDLVRNELGDCIKEYLVGLVDKNPELLEKIIRVHFESIKSLAIETDELYNMFIDWLPFETSFGSLKLKEIRKNNKIIYYTPSLDEFRQMSQVAKSQGICVLNTAYVHDTALIEKLPKAFPEIEIRRVDPTTFTSYFHDIDLAEREQAFEFMQIANLVLQPYNCTVEMKKFTPREVPALYATNQEALFWRTADHTQEEVSGLFTSVIEQLKKSGSTGHLAQLCFNFDNPIIQKALEINDRSMAQLIIETLYVQALLMGNYPLRQRELVLLNNGLLRFMEKGL